jgi:hypothetical protein
LFAYKSLTFLLIIQASLSVIETSLIARYKVEVEMCLLLGNGSKFNRIAVRRQKSEKEMKLQTRNKNIKKRKDKKEPLIANKLIKKLLKRNNNNKPKPGPSQFDRVQE